MTPRNTQKTYLSVSRVLFERRVSSLHAENVCPSFRCSLREDERVSVRSCSCRALRREDVRARWAQARKARLRASRTRFRTFSWWAKKEENIYIYIYIYIICIYTHMETRRKKIVYKTLTTNWMVLVENPSYTTIHYTLHYTPQDTINYTIHHNTLYTTQYTTIHYTPQYTIHHNTLYTTIHYTLHYTTIHYTLHPTSPLPPSASPDATLAARMPGSPAAPPATSPSPSRKTPAAPPAQPHKREGGKEEQHVGILCIFKIRYKFIYVIHPHIVHVRPQISLHNPPPLPPLPKAKR